MKRVTRDRKLPPEDAAKYKRVREQVDVELPELVSRHHDRVAATNDCARSSKHEQVNQAMNEDPSP